MRNKYHKNGSKKAVIGAKSKVDGLGSKWTVPGPWVLTWTVQTTENERSYIKLDGPKDWKWTVCENERSVKMDGPNERNWTHFKDRPISPFWTLRFRPNSVMGLKMGGLDK